MTSPWIGQTALVTGASSGIGLALARALAHAGCHLVLTARRDERLRAIRDELGKGRNVTVFPADLSERGAAAALAAQVTASGLDIDIVANNAGIGLGGPFATADWDRTRALIQLNVEAPLELTRHLLPPMLRRGRGHILFVSSVVAFTPVPSLAAYAASKAFVRMFGEALSQELESGPVRVTVVCPGTTATDFFPTAGYGRIREGIFVASPEEVAATAVRAMARGQRLVVPGTFNRMLTLGARLLPTSAILRLGARMQRARLGPHS